MKTKHRSIVPNWAVKLAGILLFGAALAFGQQQVNLTAGPANTILPDGSTVPMWGYTCGSFVSSSTATCAVLNPASAGNWSPVIITVPTGQQLQINLTNNLTFSNGNSVPTSLVIVGQIGGGLGTSPKAVPSPVHNGQNQSTWPIVSPSGNVAFTPPKQPNRVQSFGTEVAAGTTTSLTWSSLRPGTYLLESGTHPSIQGPMGLYGIVVVTSAPTAAGTGAAGTAGTAYPNVSYDAEIPLLMSEIDPVQNKAVSTAVNTAGFSETAVWSGQPGGCGNPSSSTYNTCYPPAVNYTPLYYLFNGVAFDKTNAGKSLFNAATAIGNPPATGGTNGQILVRFVNAGLRMHVPSIIGATASVTSSGKTAAANGFALIAEDGNPLPGAPRIQSEVFMAAGKTYDVMISAPPAANNQALPVFDRELSLSGGGSMRDAGMLAYIGVNNAPLPQSASFGSATAKDDAYSVVPANVLTISDVSKGLIANDINVYGVAVKTAPTNGTLVLSANGTFTYTPCTALASNPCSSWTGDTFAYTANGNSALTANVTLNVCSSANGCLENANGITVNNVTYTSNIETSLIVRNPGILSVDSDAAGHPLTVVANSITPASSSGITGISACGNTPTAPCVIVDPNGGLNAMVSGAGTYAFTYKAQNSQGTQSGTATVTLVFPKGSGLQVTVKDGTDKTTLIQDYRWIIEEDKTFYINPNCTVNTSTPPAGCPTSAMTGTTVPLTFGTNFATSSMPFVAQGCTGALSCESGQTVYDPNSGNHIPAVCDIGNGKCRPDPTGNGLTVTLPSSVKLDPTKRYYISVLPGDAGTPFANGNTTANCANGSSAPGAAQCGHSMGGTSIAAGQTSATVWVQPSPLPTGKLAVFVYEDDFPLNGEQDAGGGVDVLAPNEPGLGGFNIQLWDAMGQSGDFTGQITYDMFNQPLTNSLAGTKDPANGNDACPISNNSQGNIAGVIVTCPKYESDGKTLSPLSGQAVIANLMPGRWGVVAVPGADRIARGEEWLQTNTLDGQKAHDAFTKVGEPAYFQEYGPANYHVSIGFANPAIINGRRAGVCNGTDINITGSNCNNTVTGKVTSERLSRTPDERLYSSGSNDAYYFTQCFISLGDPDGEDFAFTKCKEDGTFTLNNIPDGQWRVTVFDQWNDMLVDGLSTPVALGPSAQGQSKNNVCPGPKTAGTTCDMGDIATTQWQTNLYTRTFVDDSKDGVSQSDELGIPLIPVNIRLRDGSLANTLSTDFSGTANFNETFPLFNWYTVESDNTRYKTTGIHVVYDAGGPADGSSACGVTGYPACGTSDAYKFMANTNEAVPLPNDLRVPGAVYCDKADCNGLSISKGPEAGGSSGPGGSTGRIDPPWVTVEGFQGFPGQNEFVEFGKAPYAPGENGGIQGHVVYASTRTFDDPQLNVQAQWEPLVARVTVNLYEESTAADGTQTLKLIDHTTTSSFDDWVQGFHVGPDGKTQVPNINCPGQITSDLFYFSLYNQPNYLNVYDYEHQQNGVTSLTPLPYNSQYKCYDGMHNWNQVQPAPYDGIYKFPSVTSIDPATGKPAGTNCTDCTTDPDSSDAYRYGTPMLKPGKYVVEVVPPAGYELVKEEDKNILIGDNFIAPVTQEFPGLATAVFILPDQASVASSYNANNPLNPTTDLGATPRNDTVPSYPVEPVWPCVGEARVVPDYISLFPQSKEVAPFAGATRNTCDRKEVTLGDQMGTTAKFYIFTSTHIASKFTGVITDDFTSEFDPFSPQFGEKFSPPYLPVAVRDWTGLEVGRVYADQWGAFSGMTYSTWEVNPPNPTGYSPNMMVMCMNDPGDKQNPDPLFNPGYSQFCYELPYMPGTMTYLDTPVVPTSAFSEGYNHPDCAYPALTPAISEVDGDGKGPWVSSAAGGVGSVTITNGGSKYTSAPTVTFAAAPGGGATATGTATLGNGVVTGATLTARGSGYTSAPTVTFSAPASGATATGTATIANGVTAVNITKGGSGYCFGATVTFGAPPAGGTRATGIVNISGQTLFPCRGTVSSITITNPGSGYTSAPSVAINGFIVGGGATGTATLSGVVSGITVTNGGSGYTSAPSITLSGGNGSGAAATASVSYSVTGVTIASAGAGYISAPSVTFTGGGGSGATANSTLSTSGTLTINALGNVNVINNGYSGPSATSAPFNQMTVSRHYGFGDTPGTVSIGGVAVPATNITTWTDQQIVLKVPAGIPACAVQQQKQYGGLPAQCGQLLITTAGGQQSVDTVTVTVGGKAPTLVTGTIQNAIDAAAPGDLIIVPPGQYQEMVIMWKPVRLQGVGAASSVINANTQPAGKLDPWRRYVSCLFGLSMNGQPYTGNADSKGNGGGSNPFDAAGVYSCPGNGWQYFTGSPYNPQVDRLPLEGILGWDTTVNGNLAQLLQEPTLMGAYEGAGITVLGKGVNIAGAGTQNANVFGTGAESAFPTGSTLLLGTPTTESCVSGPNGTNPYSSNFYCNPSSIDGLSVTDSSQGGGGIFVHAWNHNLEIANNRVYNNIGTLSGGINVGQGESPDAYLAGDTAGTDVPASCKTGSGDPNQQLPYCFDVNVKVHNNAVTMNTSIGDELFSGSPAGAGGVSICTGADYYQFNYNWVCGNMSTGDGGGFSHVGFIWNGDIEHNTVIFNQSLNPTISTNGGGILAMGAPPDGTTTNGQECGNTAADADCVPGLSDGTGPGLVINANLIMGNAAESGSGGGLRLQDINGTEVPLHANAQGRYGSNAHPWNDVLVTNNIIVNNVAGWDGGGISLQDALAVKLINNTIMSNDSTATAGPLFNTIGAPLASAPGATSQTDAKGTSSLPQPAGLVSVQNSPQLLQALGSLPRGTVVTCPSGQSSNKACTKYSNPIIANDLFWQNRSFYIGVGSLSNTYQQNIVTMYNAFTGGTPASQTATGTCDPNASYWDLGIRGDSGPSNHALGQLAPTYSIVTDPGDYPGTTAVRNAPSGPNSGSNPNVISQYCNGSRTPPEYQAGTWQVPPGISDATVPNPIFNLTPSATVDEGNNWVNMTWGPLAMTNPVTGATLGNYAPGIGSPAIDKVPTTTYDASLAPNTDFFGNSRPAPGTPIDIGAVEYHAPAPILTSITPDSGSQNTTVAVTLHGTNLSNASAITVSGTNGPGFVNGVTVNSIGVQSSTTVTATFAIARNATLGTRNVTITTPSGGTSTQQINFTVK